MDQKDNKYSRNKRIFELINILVKMLAYLVAEFCMFMVAVYLFLQRNLISLIIIACAIYYMYSFRNDLVQILYSKTKVNTIFLISCGILVLIFQQIDFTYVLSLF